MKTKLKSALSILAAFLAISLNTFSAFTAGALEDQIQLSPVTQRINLDPGETFRSEFKLQNIGDNDFKFKVSATHYCATDENYSISFEECSDTTYSLLPEWITFDTTNGVIEKNGSLSIPFTINVPQDAPAGGQYASILAWVDRESEVDKEKSDTSSISTISRVALVIYASISGVTRMEGTINENSIPAFLFTTPLTATASVSNTGNTHSEATYSLQVFPLFSGEEIFTNEENPETRMVLPDTTRILSARWEEAPKLGIFRVVQTVKFLNDVSTTTKVVFICPIWFLLIILVLIFLCVFWVISRIRAHKKSRR